MAADSGPSLFCHLRGARSHCSHVGAARSESAKPGLPPPHSPWKPTFPPAKPAVQVSDGIPEPVASKTSPVEPPEPAPAPPAAERAPTEPPPLPEPPVRGAAKTAEASIVLSEELGAPAVSGDHTEIVVPLPLEVVHTAPVRGKRRHRFAYAGAALVLFGAAALAVTVATSSDLPKPVASRPAAVVAPAPSIAPAAPAEPASAPAPSNEVVVEAAPPPASPSAELLAPVAADPAPIAVAKPTPVERTPARRPARAVKKPTKPKYDPDALFFKGK